MASSADLEKSTIKVGGKEIREYKKTKSAFAAVRAKAGLKDDFLSGMDIDKDLKPGGGKGGDLMAFSPCRRFLVKQLNSGDHGTHASIILLMLPRAAVTRILICSVAGHALRAAVSVLYRERHNHAG